MKYYIIESGGDNSQHYQVVKHDVTTGREIISSTADEGGPDELFETTEAAMKTLLVHIGIDFEEMLSEDYIAKLLEDLKENGG